MKVKTHLEKGKKLLNVFEKKTIGEALIPQEIEYINKSFILSDILEAYYQGKFTSNSYPDPNDPKTIKITDVFKLRGEGKARLTYPESLKPYLNSFLSFALRVIYPFYDLQVGEPINSSETKQIPAFLGLAKRKKGVKEIEGYYPRVIKTTKQKIEGLEKIILELEKVPIILKRIERKNGKEKIKNIREKISGTTSLVWKREDENGRIIYIPHPYLLLASYGQTLEKAQEYFSDNEIRGLKPISGYFKSRHLLPSQRKTTKEPTLLVEEVLDKEIYHLKRGETTRTIPISRFRRFYSIKRESDFKKEFKRSLKIIQQRNGGEFWFTDYKGKKGSKNKEWGKYLLVDYKTYHAFNLSRGKSDATKSQK